MKITGIRLKKLKKLAIRFTIISLITVPILFYINSFDKSLKFTILQKLRPFLPAPLESYLFRANVSNIIIFIFILFGIFITKNYIIIFFYNIKNSKLVKTFEYKVIKVFQILYSPVDDLPIFVFKVFTVTSYLYVIWRMLSRNYAVYSFTGEAYLKTSRLYLNFSELIVKPYEIVSLQFIHRFIELPSYQSIIRLQVCLAILCFIGLFKYKSKIISLAIFIGCMYLSGFVLMTNGELEATEIMLFALLTIVINNFSKKNSATTSLIGFNWFVGFYYFSSGLNKLIDVGIKFIWTLNLDERRYVAALDSFDVSSRYANQIFAKIIIDPLLSDFFGLMTLLIECSFLLLFFNSKYSIAPLIGAIFLNTSVFLMVGINFTGNTVFLLLSLFLIMKLNNIQLTRENKI